MAGVVDAACDSVAGDSVTSRSCCVWHNTGCCAGA